MTRMRTTALVLAVSALTACSSGGDAADTAASIDASTTAAGATASDTMGASMGGSMSGGSTQLSDASTVAQIDTINGAGAEGLTGVPLSVAGPLVQSLENKLNGANMAPATEIATDLRLLRETLTRQGMKGTDVAPILRRLADKTAAVAGNAAVAGAAAPKLTQLASTLRGAATRLEGK